MRVFKVAAGTSGVYRDLEKFCSFSAWKPEMDVVFTESEYRGFANYGNSDQRSSYIFVRGMKEYSVPAANVVSM